MDAEGCSEWILPEGCSLKDTPGVNVFKSALCMYFIYTKRGLKVKSRVKIVYFSFFFFFRICLWNQTYEEYLQRNTEYNKKKGYNVYLIIRKIIMFQNYFTQNLMM